MSLTLSSLGWNPSFSDAFAPLSERGLVPGRVCEEHRGQLDLLTEGGPVRAMVRPTLLGGADAPTTGDWVAVRLSPDPSLPHLVEAVLPRASAFVRKGAGRTHEAQVVAANVDVVLVATSLNDDLNLRRIERYLAAVIAGGAEPVVVLTKADLVPDPAAIAARVRAAHVVALSAIDGTGLDGLLPFCGPGRTVAVVGSSGVGKSTLINALLGAEVQDTGGIRLHDDRGKHTTVARTLLPLPGGGCLIDTPGMRELGLWAGDAALDAVYDDVAELAAQCRFRDCAHQGEPGCAVHAAVEAGALDPGRVRGFHKLQRELAAAEMRQSRRSREEQRRWGKTIRNAQRVRRAATGKD